MGIVLRDNVGAGPADFHLMLAGGALEQVRVHFGDHARGQIAIEEAILKVLNVSASHHSSQTPSGRTPLVPRPAGAPAATVAVGSGATAHPKADERPILHEMRIEQFLESVPRSMKVALDRRRRHFEDVANLLAAHRFSVEE